MLAHFPSIRRMLLLSLVVLWCTEYQKLSAQEPVRMRETLAPGHLHQVQVRVELRGALTLPLEKGESRPKQLVVKGQSSIYYIERILPPSRATQIDRTFRLYQKMDFE